MTPLGEAQAACLLISGGCFGWVVRVLVTRGTRWRHRKRGTTYEVLGTAKVQSDTPIHEGDHLVVYRGDHRDLWARPEAEFHDGRFELIG